MGNYMNRSKNESQMETPLLQSTRTQSVEQKHSKEYYVAILILVLVIGIVLGLIMYASSSNGYQARRIPDNVANKLRCSPDRANIINTDEEISRWEGCPDEPPYDCSNPIDGTRQMETVMADEMRDTTVVCPRRFRGNCRRV